VLPATPAKKKGARGETWFYCAPGVPSRAWVIDGRKVVEILGPGRQTVLPPTIHPDLQRPYRWTGAETLEDIRPQDLPALPIKVIEWIDAALTPFGYEVPEPREPGDADTPHRQLNEAALANLSAWVVGQMWNCLERVPGRFCMQMFALGPNTGPNRKTYIFQYNIYICMNVCSRSPL
jgi:hypothetical protein